MTWTVSYKNVIDSFLLPKKWEKNKNVVVYSYLVDVKQSDRTPVRTVCHLPDRW